MPELLCRAEILDKLQAVCHRCGGPATMTQRLLDGAPAPADGATIVVGALDSYEARCRACHELAEPGQAEREALHSVSYLVRSQVAAH
jgi:thymidine kinase